MAKLYVLNYASLCDNELYTECVGIYPTLEMAQDTMREDYEKSLKDDFGEDKENTQSSIGITSFEIKTTMWDYKFVSETITEIDTENPAKFAQKPA